MGEDTDLAWRARHLGASTAFVADAVVWHDVWPSDYVAHLRDMRRREGAVLAFSKHPDLRRQLDSGVFLLASHPPALVATASLALLAARPRSPGRWIAAAGAGLWYAWVCRKHRPNPRHRRQWAVIVPLALVADLYEFAVMARASIRYRTLLL
jgi:GT2 family glycosyltransferase